MLWSLHAERLLKHALKRVGLKVRSFGVRAIRVRSDGSVGQEDFRDARFVFWRIEKSKRILLLWLYRMRRFIQ